MEFKITEAEAREMAKFEEEVGGDLSAGPDWGENLGKVINLVLERDNIDRDRVAIEDVEIDRAKMSS